MIEYWNVDGLVKSRKDVTPAKAGVQNNLKLLDSRFRGNDKNGSKLTFYESINVGKKEDRNNGRMVIGERSHKIKLGGVKNG